MKLPLHLPPTLSLPLTSTGDTPAASAASSYDTDGSGNLLGNVNALIEANR